MARKKKRVIKSTSKPKKRKPTKRKSTSKVVYSSSRQTGSSDLKSDKLIKAMPSGKRKTPRGKVYYEYRKNRTDRPGTLTGTKDIRKTLREHFDKEFDLREEILALQKKMKEVKLKKLQKPIRLIIANKRKEISALKKYSQAIENTHYLNRK